VADEDNKILALLGFSVTGDMGPWTFYRSQRGQLVFFPRAPAMSPPTPVQLTIRQRFSTAGFVWSTLTDAQRANWLRIARVARLRVGGYNLFVYWWTTHDRTPIQTLERQTGITVQFG
jgi:hypothetical protein